MKGAMKFDSHRGIIQHIFHNPSSYRVSCLKYRYTVELVANQIYKNNVQCNDARMRDAVSEQNELRNSHEVNKKYGIHVKYSTKSRAITVSDSKCARKYTDPK